MQVFSRSWLCMSGWKHAIEEMDRSTCAVCLSILCNTKILDTGNVEYDLRMRGSENYAYALPILDQAQRNTKFAEFQVVYVY